MEDTKIEKDKQPSESYIKEIKRNTRSRFSAEEKIRIVMMGIRGEGKVSEICRQFGIVESLYYKWSKYFRNRNLETKRRVQKMVFPVGIVINTKKRQYITSKVNALFSVKREFKKASQGKIKGFPSEDD